ncbi:MAG: hypothetical protein N2444_00060 [Methylocystis sp.]|nr:hypothetical protein [Methylocystis sp.]
MANPNVNQGVLNRLIASVIIPGRPNLNITPPFLLPEGIQTAMQGQSTTNLPTMTGVCPSQEPYMIARSTVHLIKAQALADAWKTQMELDSYLGDVIVRPDSKTLSPFAIGNASIVSVDALNFGGRDAGFVINIEGVWIINQNAWQ